MLTSNYYKYRARRYKSNSVIKSVQRGIIDIIAKETAFVDIKIQSVDVSKSILIFNPSISSATSGGVIDSMPIATLLNSDTIRVYSTHIANFMVDGAHIPKCAWQVIEFN